MVRNPLFFCANYGLLVVLLEKVGEAKMSPEENYGVSSVKQYDD